MTCGAWRLLLVGLSSAAMGCTDVEPLGVPFDVRPGVEIVTVVNAAPRAPLTLYDPKGQPLLTLIADELGQAHFAYIPDELLTFDSNEGTIPVVEGGTLKPGKGYVIRADEGAGEIASAPFDVLAVEDVPDVALYESQSLSGVHYTLGGVASGESAADGFNYLVMRDGVALSAMVRFPDRGIWGEGPWPTVIEYSGYSPSHPDNPEPGTRIATLLGFATVAVNMRGSGCSGGVFDVFNPAQHADGYDIVEIVARQPWVLHNRVGMVGLSYSGIAQLFVGSTRPPSLAALTPLSVIGDPWEQQWPGGVYNAGFTRQWLQQRDAQAAAGGQRWTDARIAAGDTRCREHQELRRQNIDFESFFRQLEFSPRDAESRSLPLLVSEIEVPVFLGGAWQDEQTGATFAGMLDRFTSSPHARFTLYNGRHPDGYSPLLLGRWLEFLQLYVAREVPRLDGAIRGLLSQALSEEFNLESVVELEGDRFPNFADDDYEGVRAAYEAEAPVRVLFENGAGVAEPGATAARFSASFDAWPPPLATGLSLYLAPEGALADAPSASGADSYLHDPEAGRSTFFGPAGYELLPPLWDIDWTRFPAGRSVSYLTEPLPEDLVVAGPGWAELWFESEVDDVNVQVTLTEVRTDDTEVLVQSGWLRLGHRKLDAASSDTFRLRRTCAEADFEPLVPGERVVVKVAIPSFGQAFRAGSRLRLTISAPGRNHGTWEFESPNYGDATPKQIVAYGPDTPSRVFLPVVGGVPVAPGIPPCPSLRGQPCRDYVASTNTRE